MAHPRNHHCGICGVPARLGCLLFVLVAVAPLRAGAQDDRKANAAQNAAVHEYEEGRFDDALEHFQEAYRLKPESSLLLAIARCRYRLKQLEAAKSCLFDFLKEDPKSVYGSEAFELLTRIENESAKAPKSKMVSCLSPPRLPDAKAADAGGAKDSAAAGGSSTLGSATGGTASAGSVTAGPGDTLSNAGGTGGGKGAGPPVWGGTSKTGGTGAGVTPWPPTNTQTSTAESKHGPWSYTALAASVAAAGVGAYFGAKNLSATSDWRAARTAADSASARNRAQSAATSANIAWATSGVLLGTGLGLFFFTRF